MLHMHSTYSDGADSLEAMARAVQERGFEYMGIADHSQTAAYAGGLRVAEVQRQWEEIDRLNEELAPFASSRALSRISSATARWTTTTTCWRNSTSWSSRSIRSST